MQLLDWKYSALFKVFKGACQEPTCLSLSGPVQGRHAGTVGREKVPTVITTDCCNDGQSGDFHSLNIGLV